MGASARTRTQHTAENSSGRLRSVSLPPQAVLLPPQRPSPPPLPRPLSPLPARVKGVDRRGRESRSVVSPGEFVGYEEENLCISLSAGSSRGPLKKIQSTNLAAAVSSSERDPLLSCVSYLAVYSFRKSRSRDIESLGMYNLNSIDSLSLSLSLPHTFSLPLSLFLVTVVRSHSSRCDFKSSEVQI